MDGANLSTVKLKDHPHVTEQEQKVMQGVRGFEFSYFEQARIDKDHPDNLEVRRLSLKRKRQDVEVCANVFRFTVHCVDPSFRPIGTQKPASTRSMEKLDQVQQSAASAHDEL